jgi:hypothetical protein
MAEMAVVVVGLEILEYQERVHKVETVRLQISQQPLVVVAAVAEMV